MQSERARLIEEGFLGVDSAAFKPLIEFVIEQGAGGDHAFVELLEFHQLSVNPRARRLRESNYRTVRGVMVRLLFLKAARVCALANVRHVVGPRPCSLRPTPPAHKHKPHTTMQTTPRTMNFSRIPPQRSPHQALKPPGLSKND